MGETPTNINTESELFAAPRFNSASFLGDTTPHSRTRAANSLALATTASSEDSAAPIFVVASAICSSVSGFTSSTVQFRSLASVINFSGKVRAPH